MKTERAMNLRQKTLDDQQILSKLVENRHEEISKRNQTAKEVGEYNRSIIHTLHSILEKNITTYKGINVSIDIETNCINVKYQITINMYKNLFPMTIVRKYPPINECIKSDKNFDKFIKNIKKDIKYIYTISKKKLVYLHSTKAYPPTIFFNTRTQYDDI